MTFIATELARLWIGGQWHDTSDHRESINPATGEVIGEYAVGFAREHSAALAGKTVIDIANPLDESFTRLTTSPTTSAAEDLAAALPDSVIIKAFNNVPAPTLFTGNVEGTEVDTFIAGDDLSAKDRVAALLAGSGLHALDAGALENARLLERLCAFGIELEAAVRTGHAVRHQVPAADRPPPRPMTATRPGPRNALQRKDLALR
jgi:hypothetical protein